MTSNAGSNKKDNALGFAKNQQELSKEKALKALSEFLRPEFLSRIDEIIVFRALTEEDFRPIARLMLNEYVESLSEKNIELVFDNKTTEYLAKKSINGKSGARDLRNLIRREVEDKIANIIVESSDFDLKKVEITSDGEKLNIKAS